MRLPGFICAGAPKAATTTLYELLVRHPDIYLPPEKEVHFFDMDENYERGLSWYGAHFKDTQRPIVGEVTPSYMAYEHVPERIARALGTDLKLIFVLRNPAERAYSEYLHNLRRGLIPEAPFEEAMLWEERDRHLSPVARRLYSFLSRGLYFRHLSNYLRYFDRRNVLVLILEEDLRARRRESVSKVLGFLGAADHDIAADVQSNRAFLPRAQWMERMLNTPNALRSLARKLVPSGTLRRRLRGVIGRFNTGREEPPALSSDLRHRLLREYFEDDIRKLEVLLERSLELWFRDDEVARG